MERQRIATLRQQGLSVREIARRLRRAPSTISRELRRNTLRHDVGGYEYWVRTGFPVRTVDGCGDALSTTWSAPSAISFAC